MGRIILRRKADKLWEMEEVYCPSTLFKIEEIKHLNQFCYDQIESINLNNYKHLNNIPKEILHMKNLTELSMRLCAIENIPNNIDTLKSLQTLDLRYNKIKSIPKSIAKLKDLRNLYITSNKLSTLPKELEALTQLENIAIGGNPFTSLPQSLCQQWIQKKERVKLRIDVPLRSSYFEGLCK